MKRIFKMFAITALMITGANAQDIKLGAKAGINFSSLGGDTFPGVDTKGKIGLHLGGVGVYMFSEKLGAQAELLYSSFGGKTEENDSDFGETYTYETKTKLDYLSLPLMAKYYVTENISVEAGPRLGFLIGANEEFTDTEIDEDGSSVISGSEDISKFTKGLDLGFNIGGSYEMENNLFFSLRYTMGLSNINEEINIGDFDNSPKFVTRNNALQISVGYYFLND